MDGKVTVMNLLQRDLGLGLDFEGTIFKSNFTCTNSLSSEILLSPKLQWLLVDPISVITGPTGSD